MLLLQQKKVDSLLEIVFMGLDLYNTESERLLKWITCCFLGHTWNDMPCYGEPLSHRPKFTLLLHNLGEIYAYTPSSPLETKHRYGPGRHRESDLAGKYVINQVDLA